MNKFSIRSKLTLFFGLMAACGVIVTAYAGYETSKRELTEAVFRQLTALRRSRAYQIERYFTATRAEVATLGEVQMARAALLEFQQAYAALDQGAPPEQARAAVLTDYRERYLSGLASLVDLRPSLEEYLPRNTGALLLQATYVAKIASADPRIARYEAVRQRYHSSFAKIVERFGYEEIYLVDAASARVVYSSAQNPDLATDLKSGPYRLTKLADVVLRCLTESVDATCLSDFDFYEPAMGRPSAFIAAPIFEGERKLGAVAIRLSNRALDRVVSGDRGWVRDGLGITGDCGIVAADHLVRSTSRGFIENPEAHLRTMAERGVPERVLNRIRAHETTALQQEIRQPIVDLALAGEEGTARQLSTSGLPSLMSYGPLKIQGLHWTYSVGVKEAEALAPVEALRVRLTRWTVLFLFAFGLLSLLLTRVLLRPLDALVIASSRVAEGEWNVRLPSPSRDEIGRLAGAFQRMLESLRTRTQAMEQAQVRLAAVLQCAPVGLMMVRADGSIETLNEEAARVFGYQPEELQHANVDTLVPESSRAAHSSRRFAFSRNPSRRAMAKGRELRGLRKDGSEIDLEVTLSPLDHDDLGTVITAVHDVSEKKRSERVLREQSSLHAALLDTIPYPMFVKDAEARYIGCNRAYEAAFGISREELAGRTALDLDYMPVEERGRFHGDSQRVIRQASRVNYELKVRYQDGSDRDTLYSLDGFHYDDGRPGGLIGLLVDVTDLKRAEAELRTRSEELQRVNFLADTALQLTNSGYWHIPLDGSGEYNASARLAALHGNEPNATFRYRVMDDWYAHVQAADPEEAEPVLESFNATLEGRLPFYDCTYPFLRPDDGRMVWLHALGHVVRDVDGKPTDMLGATQDVTRFKLLERQLVEALDKAEAAARAKADFLANMSHEIRTPMNGVLGMVHLALQTELKPRQRDYLVKAQRAGEHLLTVINDILDFSKIESGRLTLEHAPFELESVLQNVASLTAPKAAEKHLEFLFVSPSDLPPILVGDRFRLAQVLLNLVNNAVKFTERGEVVLRVRCQQSDTATVVLEFSVSDTGIGLSEQQRGRLFQPFSQADTSTTRKFGGTGLGLAISKQLVELMEGTIGVESELGKGSQFWFTARFGITDAQPGSVPRRSADLRGLRALVVDDSANAREVLCEMLQSIGVTADCAACGMEALGKLGDAGASYDVVLLDWRMPSMDGIETARRIRSQHPDSPKIVMISAYGGEEFFSQVRDVRTQGTLLKPISASSLFDTLIGLFATTTSAEQSQEPTPALLAELPGVRVLLVEDNAINMEIAREILTLSGAVVTTAEDGAIALGLLDKEIFDIVLMDLQMPNMDGFQATAAIRKQPRFRNLPVIAMTAHAMAEDRARCLEAGMSDYLTKPIDPERVFKTIQRWVSAGTPVAPHQETGADTSTTVVIDIDAGRKRVGGNTGLYIRLLRRFLEENGGTVAAIRAALEANDLVACHRLAHTVKGVAGNLALAGVALAAQELEHAMRQAESGDSDVAVGLGKLEEFETAMERARIAITEAVIALRGAEDGASQGVSVSSSAPLDSEGKARLQEVLALLERGDPNVLAHVRELRLPGVENLERAVESFDFEQAIREVNRLLG